MKIKILRGDRGKWYFNTDNIGKEFCVTEYYVSSVLRFKIGSYAVYSDDCFISELPESFCVEKCDDKNKWDKYIKWLNETNDSIYRGIGKLFYGVKNGVSWYDDKPFAMQIHIDDIIKHIDYMETKDSITVKYENGKFIEVKEEIVDINEEFDLTTNEGRLAYAKKHYPIGTEYVPLDAYGLDSYNTKITETTSEPRWLRPSGEYIGIYCGIGFIYANGKWAEIVKEDDKMKTQKLSRKGLKEIHSVACSQWKGKLEGMGIRNSLEDYIELTQDEVDEMFKACTKEQLPIVSKYLKQNDGSVNVTKLIVDGNGFLESDKSYYIIRDREMGKYAKKSFLLSQRYNWEIKEDEFNQLCLIPTKKK